MDTGSMDEFEERFRKIMAEARRIEERFMKELKEFEFAENCVVPLYELVPTTDGYTLTVDLPGVEKHEVTLRLVGNNLVVRAPCRSIAAMRVRPSREPHYFIRVPLPADVDTDSIKASIRNGLLKVSMRRESKGYEIKVE